MKENESKNKKIKIIKKGLIIFAKVLYNGYDIKIQLKWRVKQ